MGRYVIKINEAMKNLHKIIIQWQIGQEMALCFKSILNVLL